MFPMKARVTSVTFLTTATGCMDDARSDTIHPNIEVSEGDFIRATLSESGKLSVQVLSAEKVRANLLYGKASEDQAIPAKAYGMIGAWTDAINRVRYVMYASIAVTIVAILAIVFSR